MRVAPPSAFIGEVFPLRISEIRPLATLARIWGTEF